MCRSSMTLGDAPMKTYSTMFRTVTGLKMALMISSGMLCAVAAHAADPADFFPEAKSDPALVLTRALVAEAGYRLRIDHPAILHVLHRRAGKKTPVDDAVMAVKYCSVFKRETPRAQRLRAAPWPYFERRAPEVTAMAKKWVMGRKPKDPCRGKARHWGSTQDMERIDIRGRVLTVCGKTANVFLER